LAKLSSGVEADALVVTGLHRDFGGRGTVEKE
jgi:hypothetical protein